MDKIIVILVPTSLFVVPVLWARQEFDVRTWLDLMTENGILNKLIALFLVKLKKNIVE